MMTETSRLTLALQPGGVLALEHESIPPDLVNPRLQLLEADLEIVFTDDPALFLIKLGLTHPSLTLHPTLRFWRDFSASFCRNLLLLPNVETLRGNSRAPLTDDDIRVLLETAPPMSGAEYLGPDVLLRYWDEIHHAFKIRIADASGSVEDWFNSISGEAREVGRIHFHLVENRTGEFPFAFLATYGSHVGNKGRAQHIPLRHALEEFKSDVSKQLQVLKSIHGAAQKSFWLKQLLESGEIFHPLAWTPNQAHRFLKDVEIFYDAGILCRIPDWWRSARKGPRMRFVVGDKTSAGLGMDALLDFKPALTLNGDVLSEGELQQIAAAGEELAFIKGKWVAVDQEKIKRSLDLFKRATKLAKGGTITLAEALKLLSGSKDSLHTLSKEFDAEEVETAAGAWLTELFRKMNNPALVRSIHPSPSFKGTLRPYQQLGLNWLHFLHHLGFGACLADDMGLGKTIQILALLQALKDATPRTHNAKDPDSLGVLLIVPASLLHNWSSEFKKFTPALCMYIAHPAFMPKTKVESNEKPNGESKLESGMESKADVILTTYGMLERLPSIKKRKWNLIILDEAQAIKNPSSQQTRTVKSLIGSRRIVMTGTPVENRLFDLWSLFDFLNPGLLGSADAFRNRARGLQENPEGYGRLRNVIQPYILRRLKTDKSLLPDLPDKVERKVFAGLEKKQIALYRGLVKKLEDSLEESEGSKRRGIILAFLTKFKQVCNHPDHYSGTGVYTEKESGKFAVLREICEQILEKHERMLVFTQYAEITEPLAEFLASIFGRPGLILTGSTPVSKRRALVEAFQGDAYVPFLVLSLKAGGTGLNLTRANHVVHFDRWWNPAVENQATDRAFRLGQTKNVMVHKFITRGTLEEKIDAMIEGKNKLAMDILSNDNEDWITKMNDQQIVEMFTLDSREE